MAKGEPSEKLAVSTIGVSGGGGTLLVVVANTFFEDNESVRLLLLYISPAFTVILGLIWLHIQNRLTEYLREKEIDRILAKSDEILQAAINSPDASQDHIDLLKSEILNLRLQRIQSYREKVGLLFTNQSVRAED